ncbi:MAG: hypothetical protein ACREQJ_11270 [Candidatus Binatia bacterium]
MRRLASWTAGAVFGTSFAALLVLSATSYWQPGNPLVELCDQIWKASGVAFLTLAALPYAVAVVRRVTTAFS